MRAMLFKNWIPSRLLSTSRKAVKRPRMNTAGSTMETKGTNSSGDREANPSATSELDREKR
jgi:hypothetical protein